jgi:hypothetical protein
MPSVSSVVENQTIIMKITEDDVVYDVHFSFPSDNVKKAVMTVYSGGEQLNTVPAVVVQSAIQTFVETKVEFAS